MPYVTFGTGVTVWKDDKPRTLADVNAELERLNGPMRGEHEQFAEKALEYLQLALTAANNAKAPRTVARIKHAISSAKGAVRAARYRDTRAKEA